MALIQHVAALHISTAWNYHMVNCLAPWPLVHLVQLLCMIAHVPHLRSHLQIAAKFAGTECLEQIICLLKRWSLKRIQSDASKKANEHQAFIPH